MRIDGREVRADAAWRSSRDLELSIDGRMFDVFVGDAKRDTVDVTIGDRRIRVDLGGSTSATGTRSRERAGSGLVTAPMPGKVVAVLVEPGTVVALGQGVVVVEAMKMENELTAAIAGVVRKVLVKPGQIVETDERLVEIAEAP